MTTVSVSEMDMIMKYLGTTRVLCHTHNRLVQMNRCSQDGKPEDLDGQVATMERIQSDFNAISKRHEIVRDGQTFHIFDKTEF